MLKKILSKHQASSTVQSYHDQTDPVSETDRGGEGRVDCAVHCASLMNTVASIVHH